MMMTIAQRWGSVEAMGQLVPVPVATRAVVRAARTRGGATLAAVEAMAMAAVRVGVWAVAAGLAEAARAAVVAVWMGEAEMAGSGPVGTCRRSCRASSSRSSRTSAASTSGRCDGR